MGKYEGLFTKLKEYFSRKFILAGTTLVMGYHLVVLDKDISGWSILAGVVLGFYNGSNVAEKLTVMRTENLRLRTEEKGNGNSD